MTRRVEARNGLVTLRDVARQAGVSPKTVSRVVNDDPAVSEDTRATVQRVIRDLDYVPDHAARMMRSATSSVIGLMTDVVATTPYSVEIVRGTQQALRAAGKTLLVANSDGERSLEQDYWRMFRAHKAAGVIYATMFHRRVDLERPDFAGPIVLVNCFADADAAPSIVPDDQAGGHAQARHLVELGHRRIGVVSLNPMIRATGLRFAGMAAAMREAGLTPDPALIVPGFVGPIATERLVAYEAAISLLDRPGRPTAIVCGNDRIALQVYAAAEHLGLSVPRDVSVMGFDDMAVISESLRPGLTTVRLPYFEMGVRAVAMLDGQPGDERSSRVLVSCPLVVRGSCAPPAR